MDISNFQIYLIPGLIIAYFVWKILNSRKIKASMANYLQQGALVVDVRTPSEFQQAHNPISINIPLNEIGSRSSELNKEKMILICCASGARSGMAVSVLKTKGFKDVKNAGAWTNTLGQ
jgi:phage shock protein E